MELIAAQNWLVDVVDITPITTGLLNQTFLLKTPTSRFILQKLNPIFSASVNLDIEAMTRHLQGNGFFTWRIMPTSSGALWAELDGHTWRMLTFVHGKNFSNVKDAALAKLAGGTVGRFHRSLADFSHQYNFSRGKPHDTRAHLDNLRITLERHKTHELFGIVSDLGHKIFAAGSHLPDFSNLPSRHSHGDLKITNIIIGDGVEKCALVDFDTIGLMSWPLEMGDAFRSWCNPLGEDHEQNFFDEDIFQASLESYTNEIGRVWSCEEVDMLIEGVSIIPLELASRFLRDVLENSYFQFDQTRFRNRAQHNLVRAKGQYSLYCDIQKKRPQLERIIKKAFA